MKIHCNGAKHSRASLPTVADLAPLGDNGGNPAQPRA